MSKAMCTACSEDLLPSNQHLYSLTLRSGFVWQESHAMPSRWPSLSSWHTLGAYCTTRELLIVMIQVQCAFTAPHLEVPTCAQLDLNST